MAGSGTPSVLRVDPQTGEVLFGFAAPSGFATRGFVVDSTGTMLVALANGTSVSELGVASKTYEDRNFGSIRNLARPLAFANGGNPYLNAIDGSGTIQLTLARLTALVRSNLAATTVYFPSFDQNLNLVVVVSDVGNDAATNNITVNGNGVAVEDPSTPGSYVSFVTMRINGQTCAWIFDVALSVFKFLFANGGGSGPVVGVPSGYVLVGNLNPSTGDLDAMHLQAIVDTSSTPTTVNAPDLASGTPAIQTVFRVTDNTGQAAANPITVNTGLLLEDPNNRGSFVTSAQIQVNSQSIDWQYTGTHYKII